MNKRNYVIHLLLICLAILLPLQSGQADDDYIEAKRLLNDGEILPLENILKKIYRKYPGKILEVELEKEDGLVIYEIEILTQSGIVQELHINASNGEVISSREDD